MTLRSYVWGMRLITLLSIFALAYVVVYFDPESSGIFGKIYFFTALFFSSSGVFNLILIALRRKLIGEEKGIGNLGISFRQGILMAILLVALMILQSFRLLVWWDGLLAVAGVFLIELYFLSRS